LRFLRFFAEKCPLVMRISGICTATDRADLTDFWMCVLRTHGKYARNSGWVMMVRRLRLSLISGQEDLPLSRISQRSKRSFIHISITYLLYNHLSSIYTFTYSSISIYSYPSRIHPASIRHRSRQGFRPPQGHSLESVKNVISRHAGDLKNRNLPTSILARIEINSS
jgi:hypothetical protein